MITEQVRRDLYSVKVRGNGFDHWCHERIFRSLDSARRYRTGLRPYSGYTLRTKIVHPPQRVVDVYVLSGNQIED